MDFSWQTAQLISDQDLLNTLPKELLHKLQHGTNVEFLDALSSVALKPEHTSLVFSTCEVLFVEICSRWLAQGSQDADALAILAALANLLPLAPYLSVYAKELLCREQIGPLEGLISRKATGLSDLRNSQLQKLLLSLFRLMVFDNDGFAFVISPAQLQLLLQHSSRTIRYLAIRLLCQYLHASDAALLQMVESYLGKAEITGQWESKTIDYTFLTLWENKRLEDLCKKRKDTLSASSAEYKDSMIQRTLGTADLSHSTACIGAVLVPRVEDKPKSSSSLVMTKTVTQNMRLLADAVLEGMPILVMGFSGAGKTSSIRDVAREVGKLSTMIVLHLNEQTDAKMLVGMYTSSSTPGSFSWRPGVLTTAVMEGRWVVIEDLDRAPKETISTILPLLEARELFVPHWGENIRAAPGFKLIATVRSTFNTRRDETNPVTGMLGFRHWLQVRLQMPTDRELGVIVQTRFPILHAYVPKIMEVYISVRDLSYSGTVALKTSFKTSRPYGPRDLLRWCDRLKDLLLADGVSSGNEPISETLNDNIFLEAVDCFAGCLPSGSAKSHVVALVAQELHVSAERVKYCLEARKPEYSNKESTIRIGRTSLSRSRGFRNPTSKTQHAVARPFAMTSQVLRVLESVAVAVKMAEPCLLVGETGTGKTVIIQQLAQSLGHSLTVVNLSQQTEAGDVLGGYKPVNVRALAIPLKEDFDDLFEVTFSSKRNHDYIRTIGKAMAKSRWARVLTLWQEAVRMFVTTYNSGKLSINGSASEPRTKKRKLGSPRLEELKTRWDKFTSDLQTFQILLSSGSKGFAFSFVEGNIVKAVRNGDWVLLDEINLASPDTLESLADLLSNGVDNSPSLLLSETGDTERIHAHKNFRIFGAMNPATDVGKRDLPIGLRSRFTELFVDSPDKVIGNLISIISAYLGNHTYTDIRAASDVAHLYFEIQRLSGENRLIDGANQKPHFSLRTLTRTLVYVTDIASIYGLRRALFEGFSMSFLTLLNRDSELLVLPLIQRHLLGAHKNSRALLLQTPRSPQDQKIYVQFRHYWLVQGTVPVQEQPHYIVTPFVERNLLNLVRATSTRRFPVLLQGPTSSGKTSMIEYLAKISGHKCVRINNHEHTDLQEYLGTYVSGPDGTLHYQEGILVHALRDGYWIILDELNLAPTDVLEALNRLLDDNRELLIPETQQVVRPHENFMLFATQNPPGTYGGRKELSRAFRNRFLELHFDDIPEEELETILRERSQIAPSFCTKIVAVYKKLSLLRQQGRLFEQKNSFATLRDLFRWALRDADDREQLAVNGFLLLGERVRNPEERLAVKRVIEDVMKTKIDEDQIYSSSRLEPFSRPLEVCSQGVIWTTSMRRLFVLVTEALKNNEPVLLVGETGSGKTTVCQAIAEAMQMQLHIVNAHQNMETGDLIGAQRPIRSRTRLEAQLAEQLISVLSEHSAADVKPNMPLTALLEAYDTLLRAQPDGPINETHQLIDQLKSRLKALFEWSDGSLVHAMQTGQYFLLDEISLADDSVLERLNSVLEPDRKLFLAEKVSEDALIVAAQGFQFLATMNPGGDYGKRELSLALRNRFTEIWVPPVLKTNEMLHIVQAKLLPKHIQFATPMVAFAAWYNAKYNPMAPCISIREVLAWVQFLNNYHGHDIYLALLHGASMVYIDGLGANPASKLSIAEHAISAERQECLTELSELFNHDMKVMYNKIFTLSMTTQALSMGPYSVDRALQAVQNPKYNLQAPTTKANAMKIIRALQLSKPILLEGNPGVGKTTIVTALAQAIGMPLTRINLSEQTDLMDLFGSDVPVEDADAGHFVWRDAPFLRAMQNGEWVLLDEMNLASQTVLEGLNACLDHRGEVYVSELDQTFSRHPGFVVFAAQNPHHQGGGRKGLPASFVNRFTVVYADAFTPQDLLMICSQNFPDYPLMEMEQLTKCIMALSAMLQRDLKIGSRGGPWEFNLRDILRWLHLLTSRSSLIRPGSAVDYQDMLILQRLRTHEDVAAVSKTLQQFLPQIDRPHDYFHNLSAETLQIGSALLSRNPKCQPVLAQRVMKLGVNLPISESVMMCIQNNWPCLLVGPSGAGKTSTILQLASCTGNDVVGISLSADMDTMDLVGGYEQLDSLRNVTSFVNRLLDHTRTNMIQQLMSAVVPDDSINALEEQLQATPESLSDILNLIREITDYPSLGYSTFEGECEKMIEQSIQDNRARFEWVDGILVKALKEGKWLVLDNANLCSPSVLDRLNSLLEPNGFLSINEHRSSNGSPYIVKPHLDFRIFLTMDPRHGELSRSMRNRSIELYMPLSAPVAAADILGLKYESRVSRFESLGNFQLNASVDGSYQDIFAIFLDHLAFSDYEISRRWLVQVMGGLVDMSPSMQACLISAFEIYQYVAESGGALIKSTRRMHESIDNSSALMLDSSAIQTLHPLNNVVMLLQYSQESSLADLGCLGSCFEILVEVLTFAHELRALEDSLGSRLPTNMTRIERSLSSSESRRFQNDSTQPLAKFMQDMSGILREFFEREDFSSLIARSNELSTAKQIVVYLRDVLDLAQSSSFDEGAFQVYQTLGRRMVVNVTHASSGFLPQYLDHKLDLFNASWKLSSGLSMEKLWTMFRPSTAKSIEHLNACLDVEALADQFDALKLTSSASVKELQILRRSIAGIYNELYPVDSQTDNHLKDICKAISDLQSRSAFSEAPKYPHFFDQFEGLRQYEVSANLSGPSEPHSILSLLSGRPTKLAMGLEHSFNESIVLHRIEEYTGISSPSRALVAIQNTLPVSMLCQLENIGEVPLRYLGSLCDEMAALSENTSRLSASMSVSQLPVLNRLLSSLHFKIYEAHEAYIHPESLASWHEYLEKSWQETPDTSQDLSVLILRTRQDLPEPHYLHRALEDYFNPSISSMHKALSEGKEDMASKMASTASAWVLFFTGCLVLYVPDRPFDPALKPIVERDRYMKRKEELNKKLKALRDFEMVFAAQNNNLRIRLVELELQTLGDEPQASRIARPLVSELGQLQGEFNNLLKSIISRSPGSLMLQLVHEGNVAAIHEIKLLRSNITQVVLRLLNGFRSYDDIVKPVVKLIQGLDVGLAIALHGSTLTNKQGNTISYICESTPFLGMRPSHLARTTFEDLRKQQNERLDPRQNFLRAFAAALSVDQDIGNEGKHVMFEAFHSQYEQWKEQLEQNQQQYTIKSSMYRYSGGEEYNDEIEEKEFESIFPSYENAVSNENVIERHKTDPSLLARCLAGLQRDVFRNSKNTPQHLLGMLQHASSDIASSSQGHSEISPCPVPAENILSALVCTLNEKYEILTGSLKGGKDYNFYVDENLGEARKIIKLTHRIQKRYQELQEAWPEHATIQDVLRTSSELLNLRHTEPIAKILTKAEQMHAYIHEWQIITSKEYSAVSLYSEFTALLVDWRRLELSTWGRLLDMEDKKCNDDVESWWFIAYEVIIAVPLSMVNLQDDLSKHTEDLFSTLGDFLSTTSMGQFSQRLRLIECFESHVRLLIEDVPSMNIISSTLLNFLSFYTQYETSIRDLLSKGRQRLQKDLKEILLLASWKDTNIVALRDSAKRSHHKLFKVIRKYRALLAAPAQTVIEQGIPHRPDTLIISSPVIEPSRLATTDIDALKLCQQHIASWNTRPTRFTYPTSTAKSMFHMSRLPSTAIDGTLFMERFVIDLIDNIEILQKETPSTMTKENAEIVKHLKSRKRKLFADTLKVLRQMGFRSSIGADALAKQASTSIILSNSPAFEQDAIKHAIPIPGYYFHKILNVVPRAKELFRNHSEDLSHREVSRSIGYLEGILHIILRQRVVLATSLSDMNSLSTTLKKVQNLWRPSAYTLQQQNKSGESNFEAIKRALQWLPGIIETGCLIIKKHSKLGDVDPTLILGDLRSWGLRMEDLVQIYKTLPILPFQVSSSLHERTYQQGKAFLQEFRTYLEIQIETNPNLAFVLKQMKLWTETSTILSNGQSNGEVLVDTFELDNKISKSLDSILVAIQHTGKILSTTPSTHQDTAWLSNTDTCLADSLKRLHPREVKEMLEDAMLKIHSLDVVGGARLDVAGAAFSVALPIIQQYCSIHSEAVDRYARFYQCLCKLGSVLAQSFSQIASKGFCTPAESSAAEAGKTEKLEEGTGLGDGEGAEDISKEIQDDEDLSELAQKGNDHKSDEEIEDQEDAVDMDQDELEGEMGDARDKEDGSASGSEADENEVDEEIGDVDDLDPSAVDEKLWDGGGEEAEKEKEGSKATGETQEDQQMAAAEGQQKDKMAKDTGKDDELSQEGAEEDDEVAQEEIEKLDPHLQEGENLDLPEEMDLDMEDDLRAMSGLEDSDMDGLSDEGEDQVEEEDADAQDQQGDDGESARDTSDKDSVLDLSKEDVEDELGNGRETEEAGSPVDTEPEDEDQEKDKVLLKEHADAANADSNNNNPNDAQGLGNDADQQFDDEQAQDNPAQGGKGRKGNSSNQDDQQTSAEDGQPGQSLDISGKANGDEDAPKNNSESQTFKKLGDALEKWYRQRRQIRDATEPTEKAEPKSSAVDDMEQDFEHLHDEEAKSDAQALGAATKDQAHALDQKTLDSGMHDQVQDFLPDEENLNPAEDQDDPMEEFELLEKNEEDHQGRTKPGAMVGPNNQRDEREERQSRRSKAIDADNEEDIDDLDNDLSTTHLQPFTSMNTMPCSPSEARRLWTHYDVLTRPLSLALTEHLRLILAPTLATKMRGDFRTGKRLNIKRIIPYIASQYKRDKIWMRRSVPSKRSYQIMLAMDDSKSMGESGSGQLAFETLALVSKSLSMLEVGEICVVGFGEEVHVAHEFDKTFSAEAGAEIFQRFSFQQKTTNVRKLIAESINLFREARARSFSVGADLWQLELIISDGVCEDHEGIRRLVRQAQEERILIVFVIVDSKGEEGESIMDMNQAVFETVETASGGYGDVETGAVGGETKLRIKRYLDGFPFGYYLVVGDVRELPGVLATALRQWFSEVVESG